jgi:hypothetical protein
MKHTSYAGMALIDESDVWADVYFPIKTIIPLARPYANAKILDCIGVAEDGCEEACSLNQTFMQLSPCGNRNIVESTACGTGLLGIRKAQIQDKSLPSRTSYK